MADAAAAAIFRWPAGLGALFSEAALIFLPKEGALHPQLDDLPWKDFLSASFPHDPEIGVERRGAHRL